MATRANNIAGETQAKESGARDIPQRTFAFACRVVKLVQAMPRDVASQVLARQLIRSGTSVGANVEEAQGSHSRRDFARRMNIARTEMRETLYWLRLIAEAGILPARRMKAILTEADELVRILIAIVKAARRGSGAETCGAFVIRSSLFGIRPRGLSYGEH